MTVDELLAKLNAMFPRAKDWLMEWSGLFRRVLGHREGADLRRAADLTLGAWAEPGCPKPAHFAANLPPLPEAERRDSPQDRADAARHARARQLEQAWANELTGWFALAKEEGWVWRLENHLARLAAWVAQCEGNARSVDEAIARYNGRDGRGKHALRPPQAIVDDTDAAIWRGQQASQKGFVGMKRGERDPPWRLKQPEPVEEADPVAAHLSKRRDELRSRIPPQ